FTLGQLDEAAALFAEAFDVYRGATSRRGEMLALSDLGDVARARGDAGQAARLYRQGLTLARAFGERRSIAATLEGVAGAAVAERPDYAVRLFAAADRLRRTTGITRVAYNQAAYEREVAAAKASLGAAAF